MDTFPEALTSCRVLAHTLDDLGFVIHEHKLVPTPSQSIVFLGFIIVSRTMTVTVTPEKVTTFLRTVQAIKACKRPTISAVAGLMGLMVAYLPSTLYGGTYIKQLEIGKTKLLGQTKANLTPRCQW